MTGGRVMDVKIIQHVLDGHPDAFNELIAKYYQRAPNYCYEEPYHK